jgi:hypothetical protein
MIPPFVGVFQSVGDLPGDADRLIDGNRASFDAISECWPFHQLHYQSASAPGIFQSVDRGDIGMIEGGEDLGFALETRHAFGITGKGFWQNLDSYITAKLGITGTVNLPIPPAPIAERIS